MAEPQTIEELQAEALDLQLTAFDALVAWQIGSFIQQRAVAENMPIAFEVARPGHQLFFFAMPDAKPDNAHWIRRKRNVVERFHCSSLMMKFLADRDGRPLLERYILSPDDYVSSGGSVPIMVKGSGCVGAVSVSGLNQLDDHRLAVDAIRSVM